jgi:hypothetical protein
MSDTKQAVDNIMNSINQDFLDVVYGANRSLNGLSGGGVDYLGNKMGFDSQMKDYLSLLPQNERLKREKLGSLAEVGGTALLGNKLLRLAPLVGGEVVRWNGRRGLLNQLKRGSDFKDINFGKVEEDTLAKVNNVRESTGLNELYNNAFIPANVVKKLYKKRILLDKYTPESVVGIGKRLFHKKGAEAGESHYPNIQEVSKKGNKTTDFGYVAEDPKTGRFVIKSLYKKTK